MEQTQTPLQIGMLLYPGFTMLDLIGPQTVFWWYAKTHLLWKTRDLVFSDSGIGIQPTATFAESPDDLDILFVPGGFGTAEAMKDREILRFLADRAKRACYVTSVCSGSLLLGAAGLLQGYQATSHWAVRNVLSMFGAEPVDARVVIDRNRITAGGVTAGIDFGLTLLAKLRGEEAAKYTQLAMEYDPHPPFNSGTPKTADPALVEQVVSMMASASPDAMEIAEQASRSLVPPADL